jgi:uncharacterized protein YukE
MNSPTFRAFAFTILISAAIPGGAACGQEQSNAPVQPTAAATAQSATPTPNPSSTPSAATAPGGSNVAQTAPTKRVWTNDDMGSVHRDNSIPNASGSNGKPAKTSDKPAAGAKKDPNAKRYQDQITALRAKLPELDEKISQLQAVLNGDTVVTTRTYTGNKIDDWHVELADLQKQREGIEAKISALQDEARHNGVPENQIPQ